MKVLNDKTEKQAEILKLREKCDNLEKDNVALNKAIKHFEIERFFF